MPPSDPPTEGEVDFPEFGLPIDQLTFTSVVATSSVGISTAAPLEDLHPHYTVGMAPGGEKVEPASNPIAAMDFPLRLLCVGRMHGLSPQHSGASTQGGIHVLIPSCTLIFPPGSSSVNDGDGSSLFEVHRRPSTAVGVGKVSLRIHEAIGWFPSRIGTRNRHLIPWGACTSIHSGREYLLGYQPTKNADFSNSSKSTRGFGCACGGVLPPVVSLNEHPSGIKRGIVEILLIVLCGELCCDTGSDFKSFTGSLRIQRIWCKHQLCPLENPRWFPLGQAPLDASSLEYNTTKYVLARCAGWLIDTVSPTAFLEAMICEDRRTVAISHMSHYQAVLSFLDTRVTIITHYRNQLRFWRYYESGKDRRLFVVWNRDRVSRHGQTPPRTGGRQ
ncbi:hypothetical protein Tco_0185561 [Tanacetum coccineum]